MTAAAARAALKRAAAAYDAASIAYDDTDESFQRYMKAETEYHGAQIDLRDAELAQYRAGRAS